MVNAGIIGLGGMGSGHLNNFIRLSNEGDVITLKAVCDVRPECFERKNVDFNIDMGKADGSYTDYNCYTDYEEMIDKENLDMVVIALPTYLHKEATIKCLEKGINVLCEKPMGLNVAECEDMIKKAKETGKRLMIGQVLRFWGSYEELKKAVDSKIYGDVIGAWFFRGGSLPKWSFEDWLYKRECGGGAMHDQHVHDVDMVQYLFGMPKAVTSLGKTVMPGSGHDSVSTNYIYDDNKAINTQDDWIMQDESFHMNFRVNFEKATMWLKDNGLFICKEGETTHPMECDTENAYYKEVKYFAQLIENIEMKNTINPPEDSLETVRLVNAEEESADNNGAIIKL